jgi:hypothetical protein
MFSTGEFARPGRVSVRMLRHYDAQSWPAARPAVRARSCSSGPLTLVSG